MKPPAPRSVARTAATDMFRYGETAVAMAGQTPRTRR